MGPRVVQHSVFTEVSYTCILYIYMYMYVYIYIYLREAYGAHNMIRFDFYFFYTKFSSTLAYDILNNHAKWRILYLRILDGTEQWSNMITAMGRNIISAFVWFVCVSLCLSKIRMKNIHVTHMKQLQNHIHTLLLWLICSRLHLYELHLYELQHILLS